MHATSRSEARQAGADCGRRSFPSATQRSSSRHAEWKKTQEEAAPAGAGEPCVSRGLGPGHEPTTSSITITSVSPYRRGLEGGLGHEARRYVLARPADFLAHDGISGVDASVRSSWASLCPTPTCQQKLTKLQNDPYRSLAGLVRMAGGYAKVEAPFSEFLWADFFRPRVTARQISRPTKPGRRAGQSRWPAPRTPDICRAGSAERDLVDRDLTGGLPSGSRAPTMRIP